MRQMLAVDYEFCTGCHTCEIACQQEHGLAPDRFGIKLTQIGPDQITERKWQYEFVPVPTDRCDRCARRQAAGKPPTCVQHCQAGCLYCGTLEELRALLPPAKVEYVERQPTLEEIFLALVGDGVEGDPEEGKTKEKAA